VLLPALVGNKHARIDAVCTASGLTSKHVGGRYEARYATNDPADIFADKEIDAVVIATRHDQHAALTSAALRAGKAVFVEKPLALTVESLAEVRDAIRSSGNNRLLVGFNRRFAPLAVQCRDFFADVKEPCSITYRVNAGALPGDSWALDPIEGGGRILGEVCHFIDTVSFVGRGLPVRVFAEELPTGSGQDISITIRLSNGSVAVIQYLTRGDSSVAKEYMEMFGGGRAAQLDNYRTLYVGQSNRLKKHRLFNQAKGHAEEMAAFVDAVKTGGPMPIDLETILAVTEATLLIAKSLEEGTPVERTALTEDPSEA
jgi:polar amino acid transport system substrate-binding protein